MTDQQSSTDNLELRKRVARAIQTVIDAPLKPGWEPPLSERCADAALGVLDVAQAGWMPIETAPMIGLVWVFGGRHDKPSIVEADGDFWRFHTGVPTHWQPLIVPASPMPSTDHGSK